MPALQVSSISSAPDADPQKIKSEPGNCGETVEIYSPSTPDSTDCLSSPTYYTTSNTSWLRPRSVKPSKSVESLPTLGAFPLGSLRITDPRDDSNVNTPLATPDVAMEPPPNTGHNLPTGGDILILDDLPADFTVGCDTLSFSTKKSFPGFRDIPPGAHLVWVAPSELTSSRSAYWIVTPKRGAGEPAEVYVKQWDKFNEVLSDPASHAEERFQKERLEQIYNSLAPYDLRAATSGILIAPPSREAEHLPSYLSNETIWTTLTSAIHPGLLNRITGTTQKSWQVTTLDHVVGETTMAEEAQLYTNGKTQLRFTFPMNAPLISPQASGSERTRQALDPTSFVLDALENSAANPGGQADDLVGEMSFAFLTGMHLGNYSLLEQWFFYVNSLVFRCYGLATVRPRLAAQLIRTFHAQLVYNERHLEGDAFDTLPGSGAKLRRTLTTYRARLEEMLPKPDDSTAPEELRDVVVAFADLDAWLRRTLGWDLRADYVRSGTVMLEDGEMVSAELSDFEDEDERGEFAPVVVTLDGGGREEGLVSWDR